MFQLRAALDDGKHPRCSPKGVAMRNSYREPSPWYFLPPDPAGLPNFWRSTVVIVGMLAFFTLGMLLMGLVSRHDTQVAVHQAAHDARGASSQTSHRR